MWVSTQPTGMPSILRIEQPSFKSSDFWEPVEERKTKGNDDMRNAMRTIWLAAGLVVLAEGVAADNLIPNGGFESGKLSLTDPATGKSEDLWHQQEIGESRSWQITDTDAHSGSHCLQYKGGDYCAATAWFNMAGTPHLPLQPNTEYTLTFWEKGAAELGDLRIDTAWTDWPPAFLSFGASFWDPNWPAGEAVRGMATTPYTTHPCRTRCTTAVTISISRRKASPRRPARWGPGCG